MQELKIRKCLVYRWKPSIASEHYDAVAVFNQCSQRLQIRATAKPQEIYNLH